MRDAAIVLLRRGFSVIPLIPGEKRPLLDWKPYQAQAATEDQVRTWWTEHPQANLGIVTGAVSNVVVLDVDGASGLETIKRLVAEGHQLPHTVRAITPGKGGGSHYFFRHPEGIVSNRAHNIPGLPGCDVRGDGGYVLAAPSVHPEGGVYQWAPGCASGEVELAEIPSWLTVLLQEPPAKQATATGGDWLQGVPEGLRDATAAQVMGHLLAKGLPPAEAEEWLLLWNSRNRPPMDEAQVRKVARSIAQRDAKEKPVAEPVKAFAVSLSALMAQEDKPINYLAQDLLECRTIGFIAAEPKVGKSFLALDIALALATGTPVLGRFDVARRYKVLLVQEEDSADMVRRRVRWLCKGHGIEPPEGAYFRVAIRTGFKIDDPRWFDELAKELAEFQPDLVIVDVLNKVHGADENAAKEMTPVMQHFEALRREHSCGFLICHHFRKSAPDGSAGRGNQRMRGSSVLGGWSECSLYLSQMGSGSVRVERESKNPTLEPFLIRIQGAKDEAGEPISVKLVYQGETTVAQVTEDLNKMLEAVETAYAQGGEEACTARKVAERAGCSPGTARKRLEMLAEAGKAARRPIGTRGGKGVAYIPVEGGQKALNDHVAHNGGKGGQRVHTPIGGEHPPFAAEDVSRG